MALYRPELWVTSGYPGNYTCTFKVAFYIESDPGATTQVIMSRNWNSSNEGVVFYYDNTADQMSVVWFTGGGSTFDQTVLGSRPAINQQCIGYLQNNSSGVKGGWAALSAPSTWVSGQTATPLPTPGSDNAINLTSNANGALLTAQNWCGWNELLSEATLSGEIYDVAVYRTNLVFEIKMNDGDVTSPWPDSSGNGNNATQQGGLAPTDRANFLSAPPGSAYQPGALPKGPMGMRTGRRGFIPRIFAQPGKLNDEAPLAVTHTTTGALSADAATVAGTAAHLTLHTSTGALSSQAATIAGTAAHQHATTGALSAQAATIAGTAAHAVIHTTTGALAAQDATIAGTAAHQHATTGALSAQAATIAGTAAHLTLHTSTGALAAQTATISGAALHPHTSTGALTAQAATIAGTALHPHTSTGALSAQAATVAGTALHPHTTTGALSAQAAAISGIADHIIPGSTHTTTGALAAQDATVAGTATHLTLHTTTGALAAQASTIAGVAAHQHAATGALTADAAIVSGAATHLVLHTSTGALAAGAATVSGAAAHDHAATGALSAQAATISGTAVHSAAGTHDATGALAAQDATMSGVAERIGTGESVLSPKFRGSPNVVIRGVKAEDEATDAPPLPAQITNVPDAPPPVELGRGVMDLLGFAPPVTPLPIETPEVPEPKVVLRKPPTPPKAPAAEAPAVAPAPSPPPPAPVAPVDPVKVVEARLDALNSQLETALSEVAALRAKLEDQASAQVQVKTVVERVAGDTAAIARREQNRQRAKEITRRLLKDLAEED